MEIVFDSSTLILLAKVEILRPVIEDIKAIIPEIVKAECLAKDTFDSRLISSIIEEDKIRVLKVGRQENITRLCKDFKIHIGEAEALSLALGRKIPLAVDDLPTIKACKILNQRFTTAIHFLIDITKSKKINEDTAIAKLEKLSFYGRYSKRIIDDAVKRLQGGV
ncbi:MAG: hypothetical protein HY097_08565 [Nitrospinae bacterium]|nr:hypothetical protein [Nitrospinota bacterium]MBI3814945.1 hypothetical protein [Nitrospinota bacterium]